MIVHGPLQLLPEPCIARCLTEATTDLATCQPHLALSKLEPGIVSLCRVLAEWLANCRRAVFPKEWELQPFICVRGARLHSDIH
jgi:hypothetical protein